MGAFTVSATILVVNHYLWLALVPAGAAAIAAVAFVQLLLQINRADSTF